MKKTLGRIKFYSFDKKFRYLKYRKLTIKDFQNKQLNSIRYFFRPVIYLEDVKIENLDFKFLNERFIFHNNELLCYRGSYYLWSYLFSYMEYLPKNIETLIQKSGEKKAIDILMNFLHKWFNDNPISSAPTWFPYAVSKRLEYLIKTYSQISNNLDEEHKNYFTYLICLHQYILKNHLETYIGYNHLLQNYKSLILSFITLNDSDNLHYFLNLYINQLLKEVDSDGCYIEKTPMYQLQIILDILDIMKAIENRPYPEKNILLKLLINLTSYLQFIEEPDYNLPMINDTTQIYPIDWKIGKEEILNEIARLKKDIPINNIHKNKKDIILLKQSGIIIVKTDIFWILSENGSLGAKDIAGHGHADNLMLLMTLDNGKRIFVDPGIGSYQKGFYRDLFRSTMMHNTLSIAGKNSSEVWSDFRVGKEAVPLQHNYKKNENFIEIFSSVKWVSGESHFRNIIINKNNDSVEIIDKVQKNTSNKKIYVNFILHPDVKYKIENKTIILNNAIMVNNNHYDSFVFDKVPYSDYWDNYQTTNRLSFIKKNLMNGEELKIRIKYMREV